MKERIDHSNYEAWLLDRLEGNLTPAQEQELDAFLAAHPELDPGMDALPTLDQLDAALSRSDKDALKRALPPTGQPSLENVDDFLVARLEGDLNAEQLHALRHFLLEHPELLRSAHLYDLVKLVPEAMAFAAKQDEILDAFADEADRRFGGQSISQASLPLRERMRDLRAPAS
ncbi:MAG: hypothetical protein ACK46C_06655 [Flavobacteriales bacterium]